ncbi:MAG: 50S ribosomal protein L15 [Geobacteraceae bacterium]|nr:50S ribosomal protein L15 [Geobacteraceae bacterium]
MELNTISPAEGSTKKRKRIGRGHGSGHGKTATKGHKGQKARSGGSVKPGFEGGQMPMQRRLPKRGFTPLTRKVYELVKIGQLEIFEAGSTVSIDELVSAGIITGVKDGVKVLADGEITKALTIAAHKFSAAAREKIAAAGGTVQEL